MDPASFYNIKKESDKSFLRALGKVFHERDIRIQRKSNIKVIDYEPSDINAETHLAWSGSLGIMVAPKGAEILKRFEESVTSDSKKDIELATELKNDVVGREPLSYEDAVQILVKEPVFASIKYKGRILSSGIFIPDGLQAYTAGIPYSGGEIDINSFELVEHLKDGTEGNNLEAIILRRAPKLTEAEKFALSELNDDELNIGYAPMCFAASAVTFTLTVSAATGMTCPHYSDYKRGLKSPDLNIDIKSANPELIARQILNSRREIIEGIIT